MAAELTAVIDALGDLAPLEWAEDWDNVGLLVEPPGRTRVRRVLLTIDLTEAVCSEARRAEADLVVAYHPPIFEPLSRLSAGVPQQRVLMQCVQAGIAVYSPHTALDAAPEGVNDWLADGLGEGERAPIERAPQHGTAPPEVGQGRRVLLRREVTLGTLLRRIKHHLGLARLRTAPAGRPSGGKVRRVLLCAGAGGAVLAGRAADVYLTGEMRHHDVLAAVERGTSVVLCEHTNTERGFLRGFARRLRRRLGKAVGVAVARADAEPLGLR